jgi:hypothetical protein
MCRQYSILVVCKTSHFKDLNLPPIIMHALEGHMISTGNSMRKTQVKDNIFCY